MNKGELIASWHARFAPGLVPQTIPAEAEIVGPLEPLVPYGLQYRLVMPDGSSFPRHQSGPGATVIVTDTKRIVLKDDFRPESGTSILKGCGGFAGNNAEVAKEMVSVYNQIPRGGISAHSGTHPNLYAFIRKLLRREYEWDCGEKQVAWFVDRPIGNPNIHICSSMGYVCVTEEEFDAQKWPRVATLREAEYLIRSNAFGDENTARIVRHLIEKDWDPDLDY